MPGVPSGRGCDACRKQKKKCDTSEDICSRCRRLQIPCVGIGKQRYKFVEEEKYSLVRAERNSARTVVTILERDESPPSTNPGYSPTNQHTYRVSAFIDKLSPSRGVKYNLAWSFGDYLYDIPARLGRNQALDAAADALITACDRFSAGSADQSQRFLVKYVEAVRALRLCLDDEQTATTSETLGAVMLLLICQIFVPGSRDNGISHSEGAAQIYRHRGRRGFCDEFEGKLINTLRGPVLFEALFNKNISLTEEEWSELIGRNLQDGNLEGQMIQCLARAPSLMRKGGFVLAAESRSQAFSPDVECEARALRHDLMPVLVKLRDRFHTPASQMVGQGSNGELLIELRYCHFLRTYGLGLFVGIVLNHIIFMSGGVSSEIAEESQRFAEEIIFLARAAFRYRPLGAIVFGMCLAAAGFVSNDAGTKAAADKLRLEYDKDFVDS